MSSVYAWATTLLILNIIWAGSYTVMKVATGSLHPLAIVFWRMLIAGVLLACWCAVRGYAWHVTRRDFARMCLVGLLSASSHLLVVMGVGLSQATDASLLYVIEPVWGIALATIMLKEHFSRAMGVAAVLVAVGVVFMMYLPFVPAHNDTENSFVWGNLLVVAGLLCEGSFSVAIKPVVSRYPAALVLTIVVSACVAFLAVPTMLIPSRIVPTTLGEWSEIAYLAVLCSLIGYLGWIVIMRHVPVNVMYFSIFIQPITGPAIAWLMIGEAIGIRQLTAGAFLGAGLAVAIGSHILSQRRSYIDPIELIPDVS